MPTAEALSIHFKVADSIIGIVSASTLTLFFSACAWFEEYPLETPVEIVSDHFNVQAESVRNKRNQYWAMAGAYFCSFVVYIVMQWFFRKETLYEIEKANCYRPGRLASGIIALVLTAFLVLLVIQNTQSRTVSTQSWLVAVFCLQGLSALVGGMFYVSQLASALLGPLPATADDAAPQQADNTATNVSKGGGHSGFEPKTVSAWFGFDRFCGVSALQRLFSRCRDSFDKWRTQHRRAMQREEGGGPDSEVPALVELTPSFGPDHLRFHASLMQMPVQNVVEGGRVIVGAGVQVVGFGVKVVAFSINCLLQVCRVREFLVLSCPKNWWPEAEEEELTVEILWRRVLRVVAAAIDPRGITRGWVWQHVEGRGCVQPVAAVLVLLLFPAVMIFRFYGAIKYLNLCASNFGHGDGQQQTEPLFVKAGAGLASGVIVGAVVLASLEAAQRSATPRPRPALF